MNRLKAFTLLELLIVIGILAVLSVTVMIVINPANLLMKSRDAKRVSELNALSASINFFVVSLPGGSLGSSQTVYISLPDTNSDCSTYSLPNLPPPWVYHCVTQANLTKLDSNGWVPINFSSLDFGSPVSHLPIDPVNNSSLYYTYTTGGSFELTSLLENPDDHDAAINDGGPNTGVFEIGTHLGLTPSTRDIGLVGYWTMDDNAANTTVIGSSIEGNSGTFVGGNTEDKSVAGQVGTALDFDGSDYVNIGSITSISSSFTYDFWVKLSGVGNLYGGVIGVSDNNDYNAEIRLNNVVDGLLGFRVTKAASGNYIAAVIGTGIWTHVAAVKENGVGVQLFIDGNLESSQASMTDTAQIFTNTFKIGKLAYSNLYVGGLFDEVRIYNRALSAEEIQARYSATK